MRFLPKRSERKSRIAHALAGFTIAVEGWERFEEAPAVAVAMMVIGALFMAFGVFHGRFHHRKWADYSEPFLFLMEAAVLGLIAAVYFHHGKKLLPWVYVCLVCAYVTVAVVRHSRRPLPASS